MCGIFGVIGDVSREKAQRCTDTLAHRGPDGSGLWHTREVTLGHRRLSILDLSEQAKQPMQSENGRYWLTFNGEIYNFVELAAELEARGYVFRTASDTEVVLAAFDAWGEQCQERFNGMWACAIWDTERKEVFLSRDRFGKKPLYYAWLPDGAFAFASEMKALFPLLKSVAPNARLVGDTSRMLRYENTEECLIEGIKRFPAGSSGWLRNGKLGIRRWWCTLDHLPEVPENYDEQVEQMRELFLDACRLRMRSDVPLGTALSGGLDSSATISCMAHIASHGKTMRMGESWQHAFVASFPGTPLDELHYARMVADHIGIEPTVIEIDPLRAISDLSRYFYLFEEMYITSPIPFMQTYAAVKAAGVSVTLDGHGADELFGGYAFDVVNALQDARFDVAKATSILDTYYDSFGETVEAANLPPKWKFFATWHGKRWLKRLLKRGLLENSVDSGHARWQGMDCLTRQLYTSTHETVLPTLLRNYDRYSMANGVEIRMPFMDHRIVTFAFALPWTSKIRGGFSKAIVRDALARYMPEQVAYRKTKIGFNSPIVDWMQGPLKPFMLDTIASQSFKECRLIDPKRVADSIRRVMDNATATLADGVDAWTMLTPYLWERALIKGKDLA
jgi:asparagine synthase (glutamine-hydrolysing)